MSSLGFVVGLLLLREGRMAGGGTQKSLRKALGALKDTTTVSLAKVNSDYKVIAFAVISL